MQSAYNGVAQGFGSMPMTSSGYGQAAFAQAGISPYGQTANDFQSGQKRDAGYDQARVTAFTMLVCCHSVGMLMIMLGVAANDKLIK